MTTTDELENFLEHFGVKGMRWGHRKAQVTDLVKSQVSGEVKGLKDTAKGSRDLARAVAKGDKAGAQNLLKKAAINITDRQIKLHENARDGKGLIGVAAKLDKATWGRSGRFEKYQEKSIAQLENSKKEIQSGKLYVRTLLFGAHYTKPKKK